MEFRTGDIIQDYEEPFVIHLNIDQKKLRCSNCLKQHPQDDRNRYSKLDCLQCSTFTYCNNQCRQSDWDTVHKIECSGYASRCIADDVSGQVLRLASFLKLNGDTANKRFHNYDGNYRCFNDLPILIDEDERKGDVGLVMRDLSGHLVKSGALTAIEGSFERLMQLYGICQTNGFLVPNEDKSNIIGAALYVLCSTFNHACRRPNAVRVMDESFRMQVRCIDPIGKKDKPTITFLAGIRTRTERHDSLKRRFSIECKCALCKEEQHKDNTNDKHFDVFSTRKQCVRPTNCLRSVRLSAK